MKACPAVVLEAVSILQINGAPARGPDHFPFRELCYVFAPYVRYT